MSVTVLVVDDDEVLGRVLARVLTQSGYLVRRAETAADALALARECHPQVALLDLCLPDGSGTALAARLRAEHEGIVLILLTAYPLRLREHPELGADFAQVLVKPLDVADLRRVVEAAALCPAGSVGK